MRKFAGCRLHFLVGPVWLVLGVAGSVSAQTFIDWFKVAGGGDASAGDAYALSGTIGQIDTSVMTGGSFRMVGGFWSLLTTVPTPSTPRLTATLTTSNAVLVCWPSSSAGFVLEQNTDLRTTNWVNVAQVPADDSTMKCVIVNPSVGNVFFRLRK